MIVIWFVFRKSALILRKPEKMILPSMASELPDLKANYRGWKLNNLTTVIHYSLGVSANYSLFFLSSAWLFIIHNRFRVQRIALVKFRFNYNTFGNNIIAFGIY